MNIYQRLRVMLEEFYEKWDTAMDVWPIEDDICTAPVPFELTEKAA